MLHGLLNSSGRYTRDALQSDRTARRPKAGGARALTCTCPLQPRQTPAWVSSCPPCPFPPSPACAAQTQRPAPSHPPPPSVDRARVRLPRAPTDFCTRREASARGACAATGERTWTRLVLPVPHDGWQQLLLGAEGLGVPELEHAAVLAQRLHLPQRAGGGGRAASIQRDRALGKAAHARRAGTDPRAACGALTSSAPQAARRHRRTGAGRRHAAK